MTAWRTTKHGNNRTHVGVPEKFTPRRVPSGPRPKTVPCPTCGAKVEEDCRSASGGITVHRDRKRMAVRKWYADQEEGTTA